MTRTTQAATPSFPIVFSVARTFVTAPDSWIVIEIAMRPWSVGSRRSSSS